jgi:bacillithiol biosynthesis deacetylase BshB1
MKLDALIIAAHPDDAEISVGGTILRMVGAGKRVGVLDLTRGEMGTRGTREERDTETANATELLGLTWRSCLNLPDARVVADLGTREALAGILRQTSPDLVIAHHTEDLHPDHAAAGRLAREAWYLSGLKRLEIDGVDAPANRPRRLVHFQGHVAFEPTWVVDISPVWERKVEVIRCYASQLNPADDKDRGEHLLFGADIVARAESKARYWGERIGAGFGEPLLHVGPLPGGPSDLLG